MADEVRVTNYSPAPISLHRAESSVAKLEAVSTALELIRAATVGRGYANLRDAVNQLPDIVEAIEKAVAPLD